MDIAAEAEAAGWDGLFLWDHVAWNPEWGGTPAMADPWMCLAAAATVMSRVTLGPIVTLLPRRRPQLVAREAVTLDHLSHGRALLGVWATNLSTRRSVSLCVIADRVSTKR
jgi:alkanesulfonate monooxygenase SsuD/methylene tetrahydromethanopterin reductase-like flavin-dependent oxidoreductase (luciferase family)